MKSLIVVLSVGLVLAGNLYASEKKHEAKHEAHAEQNQCIGAGPQSPRDIDSKAGSNKVIFNKNPGLSQRSYSGVHRFHNRDQLEQPPLFAAAGHLGR